MEEKHGKRVLPNFIDKPDYNKGPIPWDHARTMGIVVIEPYLHRLQSESEIPEKRERHVKELAKSAELAKWDLYDWMLKHKIGLSWSISPIIFKQLWKRINLRLIPVKYVEACQQYWKSLDPPITLSPFYKVWKCLCFLPDSEELLHDIGKNVKKGKKTYLTHKTLLDASKLEPESKAFECLTYMFTECVISYWTEVKCIGVIMRDLEKNNKKEENMDLDQICRLFQFFKTSLSIDKIRKLDQYGMYDLCLFPYFVKRPEQISNIQIFKEKKEEKPEVTHMILSLHGYRKSTCEKQVKDWSKKYILPIFEEVTPIPTAMLLEIIERIYPTEEG